MAADKTGDPILNLPEIIIGLLCADHRPVHANRMDYHCPGRHNVGIIRAHRDRDANGMTAAQHKGNGRLAQRSDHLCNRKPRFDISAHRIQQNKQTTNILTVLYRRQLR